MRSVGPHSSTEDTLIAPTPPAVPRTALRLRPEQQRVVERARSCIQDEGGVLLASDVGQGKSYEAMGLARALGLPALVCCPAPLVPLWTSLLDRHDSPRLGVFSHGQLSRQLPKFSERALLIVDEAHAFLHPTSRRYRHLARLCLTQPTALLTATPLRNDLGELRALLHLISAEATPSSGWEDRLGALYDRLRVAQPPRGAMDWRPLMRRFYRGTPEPDEAQRALAHDAACLALGEEGPHALLELLLLRRQLSSTEALSSSLLRLARYLESAAESLDRGVVLTREVFEAQAGRLAAEADWQPALPGLLDTPGSALVPASTATLLRARARGLRALLTRSVFREGASPLALTLELARRAAPSLVFTCHRSTGLALLRRSAASTLLLTGRLARDRWGQRWPIEEVLSAFDRGELPSLILSDAAGQGLDLDRAASIVHHDLPWTPAQLHQREGRAQRGRNRAPLRIWQQKPPHELEERLRLVQRLELKEALFERWIRQTPPGSDNLQARPLSPPRPETWALTALGHLADQLPIGFRLALDELLEGREGDVRHPDLQRLCLEALALRPRPATERLLRASGVLGSGGFT